MTSLRNLAAALLFLVAATGNAAEAGEADSPPLPVADAVALPDHADQLPEVGNEDADDTVVLPAGEAEKSRLDQTAAIKPKSKWRTVNFVLGAVGGALLGGYVGFIQSSSAEGVDEETLPGNLAIYGSAGAAVGGLVGLVLGALVAPDPVPPSAALPAVPTLRLGLVPKGPQLALRYSF